MKSTLRHSVSTFALALALSLPAVMPLAAKAQTPAPAVMDAGKTVARVNGESITAGDVKKEMEQLPPQLAQVPLQAIYPQLLEQLVIERAVKQAGYAQKLQDDAVVKERLKDAEGKIVADEYLRRQIKAQVTDTALKSAYEDYKKAFKAEPEARASHILVKTEAEANEIIKQLKGGADFAKLASEKSVDKAAAKRGGDLGYFKKDDMVKAFSDAAFAMKAGDTSTKPVKSEFGWHVIKLVDKRDSQPASFEQMKPQLEAKLDQVQAQKTVKDIVGKAKVERFQLDGSTPLAAPAATPGSSAK